MNILFITSDQHRADCLGIAGHPCIQTPNLDRLAMEGTVFDAAYSDCPVCIPARTTLITGRQAHHNGCPSYQERFRVARDPSTLLGSQLRRAGYHTVLVGKTHWHLDRAEDAGFETLVGTGSHAAAVRAAGFEANAHSGIAANQFDPALCHLPPHLHSSAWLTSCAIELLEKPDAEGRPLFLWVSYTDPHPPNTIHEPYFSCYDRCDIPPPVMGDWTLDRPAALEKHQLGNRHPGLRGPHLAKARGVYYGKITHLDHQVGRLIGALQRSGRWDNTLIVYTSDHGEHLGDHGDFSKSTFLESAARVPLLARLPGGWRAGQPARVAALVQHADLLPTFCDAAGIAPPQDVDGSSLLPLLHGEPAEPARSTFHGQIDGQHCWIEGDWKLLYFVGDGRTLLFHRKDDPQDLRNRSEDEPGLRDRLRDGLLQHLAAENHPDAEGGRLAVRPDPVTAADHHNLLGWMAHASTA